MTIDLVKDLDKILYTCFYTTDEGKIALQALQVWAEFNDMPQPADLATANFKNGMKAVIARIFLANGLITSPESIQDRNPMGLR
jgi:hypothetical protein